MISLLEERLILSMRGLSVSFSLSLLLAYDSSGKMLASSDTMIWISLSVRWLM
jgi:hypothetical protein